MASTDASSSITRWDIDGRIYVPPTPAGKSRLFLINTHTIGDPFSDSRRYDTGHDQFYSGVVYNNPGTWTIVPEPSTFVLSILGISMAAAARRLRHE